MRELLIHEPTIFLNIVDATGDLFDSDSKARIFCMRNKLRGNAITWYQNQEVTKLTWREWKDELTEVYPPEQNVFTKLKDLVNYYSEPSQCLVDFYYKKLSLRVQCKLKTTSSWTSLQIPGTE